jgi:cytochrome c oxidase cbb3-type subunit 3
MFIEYNCYGCHGGLAGGAMGPSLRDTVWKYGGTDSAISLSIRDGRPLGMPTWKPILADSQIRNLVTYIRSLRTSAEPKFFFIGQSGAEGADTTRPPSP